MTTPQVPPRPARSQEAGQATSMTQAPTIPSRLADKRAERPESPRSGGGFVRSPLNEPPFNPYSAEGATDLHKLASFNASRSSLDLPARPPSVSLPSIGQEGMEYDASTPQNEEESALLRGESPVSSPQHTREVSHDLPLHAPKPSLSSSDAKQRVAAVVRTDSNAAATSVGGKSVSISDKPLKSKPSFNRPPSSASYDRPGSAYEDEQGIPRFGQQVPLGHQYGDVQAPSPAPSSQPQTPSTPGFERPGSGRHHQRTRSGRNSFQAPPGSYGLHGHGHIENVDQFEKEWLQKHPEVLRDEIAAHSPAIIDRHDYNLTPNELNKLVRKSQRGGMGTSAHVSMPDEQIGYLASEAYASRNATPKPPGTLDSYRPTSSNVSQVEPSLRQPSISAEELPLEAAEGIIHVDEPAHKESKHIGRGQVAEQEHVDLGPHGNNTEEEGWVDENNYGVPILASDEIDPANAYLHPAVPPISDSRRGSFMGQDDYSSNSRPNSRPSSRPGSIQNVPALSKTVSRNEWDVHTLEDVREYEPLFPDEEAGVKKPSTADRFKQRPDMKQRFPSKDIWEDAPASVNLETEVDTPEPERKISAKSVFETPEQEAARRGEISEAEKARLLPKEARLAQSKFQPHLKQEMRPAISQHRFPSRDIWEDSPDSAYITTTVGEDEGVEDLGSKAGAIVHTTTLPREGATAGAEAVKPNINDTPLVPPRPNRSKSPAKDDKTPPQIPNRPARRPSPLPTEGSSAKPIIPARPSKPKPAEATTSSDQSERELASDSASKPKPQIPARPAGNKIAALQAGFMSDLNKKLGLGPQSHPQKKESSTEEQAKEEKKPLEDARKGRARGPTRRKPAASPSAAASTADPRAGMRRFMASPVMSLFDIPPDGSLNASHANEWSQKLLNAPRAKSYAPIAQEITPAVGFNAQGEAVHPPTVTPEAIKATSQVETAPALQAEAETSGEIADIGHTGASSSVTAPKDVTLAVEKTREPAETTSGTQTGEMNITLDKDGASPTLLTGYKNGSVHEEGIAFVKKEENE